LGVKTYIEDEPSNAAFSNERPYATSVAVERAIDLLTVLARRRDAGVNELARELHLSGSAVHRILVALCRKGVVEQDRSTGRYALSWVLMSLAAGLSGKNNLRSLALPHMTSLRDAVGETITLFARSGFQRVCIEQVEGLQELHWRADLGRVFPLYTGASGKLILAYLSDAERERYFATVSLDALTEYTTTDRADLERELAKIAKQGWAVSRRDRMIDAGGASVPILSGPGRIEAALTIAGPAWRLTAEAVRAWIPQLQSAAAEISQLLGHTQAFPDAQA
jgi:DNA-binding IclR family transcriptional regulator